MDEISSFGTQPSNKGTTVDQSSSDSDDFVTPVKLFLESGCGRRYGKNNSSCTKSVTLEELVEHRMQCIELSSSELDLILLGAKQSHINLSSNKKRYRMGYCFRGVQVSMRAKSAGTVNAIAANFAVIPPSPPNNVELGGLNRRYTSKISVDVR